MALSVSVVSLEGEQFSGEALSVRVPSVEGALGILPGRQPLVAALETGVVNIEPVQGEVRTFRVDGGFAAVDSDVVTIVVDHLLDAQ